MNFIWIYLITLIRRSSCCLEESGTLVVGANIQYLCTQVRGKVLLQLDTLSVEVGSTTTDHLKLINLVLGTYFSPGNAMSKQKRLMRCGMSKTRLLKVRC